MARRVLLGLTFIFAFFWTSSSAWGQAAPESALANSNSAAAGSKVGSALSKGLSQATEKLGNQVSNAVQPQPARRNVVPVAQPTPENPLPQDRAWPKGKVPLLMPLGDAGLDCTNEHRARNHAGKAPSNDGYTICASSATAKTKQSNDYKKVVEVTF